MRPDAPPGPLADPDAPDDGSLVESELAEGENAADADARRSVVRRGVFNPPRAQSRFDRPPRINVERPGSGPGAAGDGEFRELLDYGERPAEWEVTERILSRAADDSGMITVFSRELAVEDVLIPVAGGLVLILSAAHIARFLNP